MLTVCTVRAARSNAVQKKAAADLEKKKKAEAPKQMCVLSPPHEMAARERY